VNSLELSLTQKNEEIEIIEDKLQRTSKQLQQLQQQQQQKSQSNSNLTDSIDSLKSKITALQKDVHAKDVQIQQLETELITLKELIDDFEEQKQVLKYKLEQQQIQFGQLERQFEQTTLDYENQLKEQAQKQLEKTVKETLNKSTSTINEEKEIKPPENTATSLSNEERDKYEAELEDQINMIKNLQDQIEIGRIELAERDEEIGRLSVKVKELENALRESVSITAEREIVFAQQKKKAEKLEDSVTKKRILNY
jgi:chromosome segregation ATPase